MNTYIVGNGFVAGHLPYQKIPDRLNPNNISKVLEKYEPNTIINCIGFCGVKNIDQCEIDIENTITANTIIPTMLALECDRLGIHCITIGSGCVYSGSSLQNIYKLMPDQNGTFYPDEVNPFQPYASVGVDTGWIETNPANPQSHYSRTKYACDLALERIPSSTVLRIRMPISDRDTPRNLINKLKNYKQIIDIPNSVTFMTDLVRCVEWAVQNRPGGIWHVTNPQPLSAVQIMTEYQKYDPNHQFDIIDEKQLDLITTAKRSNCILDSNKLKLAGFKMSDSIQSLESCMERYCKMLVVSGNPCPCHDCASIQERMMGRMILCPVCGNKRCPRAANHINACTGSNEPGQPGSLY